MLSEIGSKLFQTGGKWVATVLAAALLAGCGSATPIKTGETLPVSDVDPATIPGLAHVHGLGVDPDDNVLYAATHFGLWRIADEAEPRRVGEYAHDFMGFSITGPNRFVASGHPNGAQDLPPHVGLIESRDAGKTWTSVSRMGEADFHVLRSAAGRIYGWSSTSGRLEVTTDRSRWTERGDIDLVDLVVDPDDDQNLLASVARSDTELDLRSSDDGGKTWNDVVASPTLVRLDWPKAGSPWGVDVDGRVHLLEGDDWNERGKLGGPPEAVASDSRAWFAAADGAVRRSDDQGKTWQVVVEYDS